MEEKDKEIFEVLKKEVKRKMVEQSKYLAMDGTGHLYLRHLHSQEYWVEIETLLDELIEFRTLDLFKRISKEKE